MVSRNCLLVYNGELSVAWLVATVKVATALVADRDKLLFAFLEAAQDGIGELAVHLDVAFAGKDVGIGSLGRSGVTEQAAENVGEEVGEQGGFFEPVGAAGGDEVC